MVKKKGLGKRKESRWKADEKHQKRLYVREEESRGKGPIGREKEKKGKKI